MTRQLTLLLCGSVLLAGCAKEPAPRTVTEFLDNPMVLEAAMVRCGQNRDESRYDPECVNARQAVARIQAKEEAERAAAAEADSERKRKALRRTQAAAAEARRRAAAAEKARREAEYLAQFGVAPPADGESVETVEDGNLPVAIVPEPPVEDEATVVYDAEVVYDAAEVPPPTSDGSLAQPEPEPQASDLGAIRDELRKRNEEDDD